MAEENRIADSVRLDVWLDVACLFRTRSEAQHACKGGKFVVNRQPAKPNRPMRIGDELEISRPFGRKQQIVVRGLAGKHIARADARLLYEDRTLPPTAEETELGGIDGGSRAKMPPPVTPDKRQ